MCLDFRVPSSFVIPLFGFLLLQYFWPASATIFKLLTNSNKDWITVQILSDKSGINKQNENIKDAPRSYLKLDHLRHNFAYGKQLKAFLWFVVTNYDIKCFTERFLSYSKVSNLLFGTTSHLSFHPKTFSILHNRVTLWSFYSHPQQRYKLDGFDVLFFCNFNWRNDLLFKIRLVQFYNKLFTIDAHFVCWLELLSDCQATVIANLIGIVIVKFILLM